MVRRWEVKTKETDEYHHMHQKASHADPRVLAMASERPIVFSAVRERRRRASQAGCVFTERLHRAAEEEEEEEDGGMHTQRNISHRYVTAQPQSDAPSRRRQGVTNRASGEPAQETRLHSEAKL